MNTIMKSVLVTGASGFIGSRLTKYLNKCGYYVIGLSRSDKPRPDTKVFVHEWVQCDLSNDIARLDSVLSKVEYVIHLAGNAHEDKKLPYSDYEKINTRSAVNLASKAIKNGVKKFVFLSTIKVNGESTEENRAFTESSIVNPVDSYSKSKYEAEKSIQEMCKTSSMSFVIVRPPLVFGEEVGANFLALLKIINSGVPLPFASVKNKRSFIYIDNLTDIIEKCLIPDGINNEIFLVKDFSVSLPELISKISRKLDSKTLLIPVPLKLLYLLASVAGRKGMLDKLVLSLEIDDRKIRSNLNWSPSVNIDQALDVTLKWYKEGRSV